MTTYPYTKSGVAFDQLCDEVRASPVGSLLVSGTLYGSELVLTTSAPLSQEQEAVLAEVVAAHTGPSLASVVKARILSAMDFGRTLMAEYGASNVVAGFTTEQLQDVVARTTLVQAALASGSLYIAIAELNALETDDTLITPARVTEFRNKIEDYLQIPRT